MCSQLLNSIPRPSLRRLPVYVRELETLHRKGIMWASCSMLAAAVRRDGTLVRKDLAAVGIAGKPGMGYHVPALLRSLRHFVGWDNTSDAFLVGVGRLGSALLGYQGFNGQGLNIVCGFDTSPELIGTRVQDREVLALEKLPSLARRMHIQIGIIAVPAAAAQGVADLMISGGIRAIWSFAPAHLDVPEDIIVETEDLSATLALISSRLSALDDDNE